MKIFSITSKYWYFHCLLITFTLISACKKDSGEEDTANGTSSTPVLDVIQLLDTTQGQFFYFASQNGGDAGLAIVQTANWLKQQSGVAEAVEGDSTYIMIRLESGIETTFMVDRVDSDGISKYRGGGGSSYLNQLTTAQTSCQNPLANKKVLIYAACYSEFYKAGQMDSALSRFQNSSVAFNVSVVKDTLCGTGLLQSIGQYGLVIFDTHGVPDAMIIGPRLVFDSTKVTEDDAKVKTEAAVGIGSYSKVLSNELRILGLVRAKTDSVGWFNQGTPKTKLYVAVTSKYLRTLPKITKTILFGNMCYSGYTHGTYYSKTIDPIATAFMSISPATYFCYTKPNGRPGTAGNYFCIQMEDSLSRALANDIDSTGVAHLSYNTNFFVDPSSSNNFDQKGDKTYCFGCGTGTLTDPRDGIVYKTICINGKQWFAEDLKYAGAGVCFNNDPNFCTQYGRLYTWSEMLQGGLASTLNPSGVKGVCPQGWHVPSRAEYQQLITDLGGTSVAGGAMKDISTLWFPPNTGATNTSGFSALPGGLFNGINFAGNLDNGFWWTCTNDPATATKAYLLHLTSYTADAEVKSYYKVANGASDMAAACRCAKD